MLDRAIEAGRKSIQIARETDPEHAIFSARYLGEAFHKSGQSDSAIVYLLEAEGSKSLTNRNSSIHLHVLLDLIDVYGFLNNDVKCRQYRDKARAYLKSTPELSKADRIIAMHDLLRVDLNLYDTVSFSHALSEYQELVKPFEVDISLPQYHTEMFQFTTDSQSEWIRQLEATIPVHRILKRWDNMALTYYLLSRSIHEQGAQNPRAFAMLDSCIQIAKKNNLTYVSGTGFEFRKAFFHQTAILNPLMMHQRKNTNFKIASIPLI